MSVLGSTLYRFTQIQFVQATKKPSPFFLPPNTTNTIAAAATDHLNPSPSRSVFVLYTPL